MIGIKSQSLIDCLETPEIESIYPEKGSEVGGTSILVLGRNFIDINGLFCVFERETNELYVPASWICTTAITCKSPKGSLGAVAKLRVTSGAAEFSNAVSFEYSGTFLVNIGRKS